MATQTIDTRAKQDGQAPLILYPWLPLLSHDLSLRQQIETVRLLHACLAQLPRPSRPPVAHWGPLPPVRPSPPCRATR